MIISGGVNIYPQEAENVLVTHPKVVDVAVFGVPNDDFGEEVKAVVQPVEMPADDDAAAALAARADRVLPRAAGRREVPALDRLPRRAPPPPDRQALQAAAQGRVLEPGRPFDLSAPRPSQALTSQGSLMSMYLSTFISRSHSSNIDAMSFDISPFSPFRASASEVK